MKNSKRGCGVIMHISSLPSKYGIGTFGAEAFKFADFLRSTGQGYWQVLPLGVTGFGDSPYQTFSMYAGNPYFIDLEILVAEEMLTKEDVEKINWGGDPEKVDYGAISRERQPILRIAFENSKKDAYTGEAIGEFRLQNCNWLEDFALFMALKSHFGNKCWLEWEDDSIRFRETHALEAWRSKLQDEMDFIVFQQYEFFKQWGALKKYVKSLGIKIIGDLPIYTSLDSADVWSRPECFQLDKRRVPTLVAGVPPDYFSADGQLWGNPLYNWDALLENGYSLWIDRLSAASELFDVIRIDHFRGFASYWAVPYGAETAREGEWIDGPGMDLIREIRRHFPELEIIAEDLGILTPDVEELLKESGLPGMKVLQFAFNITEPSDYLPYRYDRHCVCYSGTHDNNTAAGWLNELSEEELSYAKAFLNFDAPEDAGWAMARAGMSSVAELFVAQMQDYLCLGEESRMNEPGMLGGNWQWRMLPDACSPDIIEKLSVLTRVFGRWREAVKQTADVDTDR